MWLSAQKMPDSAKLTNGPAIEKMDLDNLIGEHVALDTTERKSKDQFAPNVPKDRRRPFRISVRIGTVRAPAADVLEMCALKLQRNQIEATIKSVQALDAMRSHVIMGMHPNVEEEGFKEAVQATLEEACSKTPWDVSEDCDDIGMAEEAPPFGLETACCPRAPWTNAEQGERIPVWAKKVKVMECEACHQQWFDAVGHCATGMGLWTRSCGQLGWFESIPSAEDRGGSLSILADKLERHMSTVPSLASVKVDGAVTVDAPVAVHFDDDRDRPPMDATLRKVPNGVHFGQRKTRVVQHMARENGGGFSLCFPSGIGCDEAKKKAQEWGSNVGGWMIHHLRKRAVKEESIQALLRASFASKHRKAANDSILLGGKAVSKQELAARQQLKAVDIS